ncbi:hypothetical protein IAT38_005964 [Cryptococcus sp. DSM 104549]
MSRPGPSRRPDGRSPTELRPLHVSVGELDRADGSGRFAFGSTTVLASANGPIEVRLKDERPDEATFEVTHRPLEGVGATPSRALVTTIENIFPPLLSLHLHPRSLLQLVLQSLTPSASSTTYGAPLSAFDTPAETGASGQTSWPAPAKQVETDDYVPMSARGGEVPSPASGYPFAARAAGVNAASLALLDAGSVPIRAVVVAVAVALMGGGAGAGKFGGAEGEGVLVLDPTVEEEARARARFGFGWAFGEGVSLAGGKRGEAGGAGGMEVDSQEGQGQEGEMELVWVESEGEFTRKEWTRALEHSKAATKQILVHIQEALRDSITGA